MRQLAYVDCHTPHNEGGTSMAGHPSAGLLHSYCSRRTIRRLPGLVSLDERRLTGRVFGDGRNMLNPDRRDLRVLLGALTAFLPSEAKLRALFWGQTYDLWEMMEAVGAYGCEIVVARRGAAGQAVQALNAAMGWPETIGLDLLGG